MKTDKNNKGFASTILVLSISALVLVLISIQSIESNHFFDEVKRKQYRLMSYYFAYSCIDQALLSISHDYFFSVSSERKYDELNCSIDSIKDDYDKKIIKVHGIYKDIKVFRTATIRVFDNHLEILLIE